MSNEMTTLGEGAQAYLERFGGPTRGTFVKFSKYGEYVVSQTGDKIPLGTQCVCVYDQTQAGWIKFNGKGNPATRHMGPIYQGFVPPQREDLGDMDDSLWPQDDNGKPMDPWVFQILLPLQNTESSELYIFQTNSKSGRRQVNDLIRRCQKLHVEKSDQYPVVRLESGSFKTPKFGEIKVPEFSIVSGAKKGDFKTVNLSEDMNDDIPF